MAKLSEEGRKERDRSIVKTMYLRGYSIEEIGSITGLDNDIIKEYVK